MRRLMALRLFTVSTFVTLLTIGWHSANAAPLVRPNSVTKSADGLIRKVHGSHCRSRYGWVRHWHGRRDHAHRRWHGHCYRGSYYRRPYYAYYAPIYIRFGRRRFYRGPRFYGGRRFYRGRRFRAPRIRGPRFRSAGIRRGGFRGARRGGFRGARRGGFRRGGRGRR